MGDSSLWILSGKEIQMAGCRWSVIGMEDEWQMTHMERCVYVAGRAKCPYGVNWIL